MYRNFDFEDFSLPVYLSVLNGNNYMNAFYSRIFDENDSKMVLLHVAPEFFNGRLRFPLSTSAGKYDPADKYHVYRHAAGADIRYQKFNLAGEYLVTRWDRFSFPVQGPVAPPPTDLENKGYYVKALYKFSPLLQGLVKYSHAEFGLDYYNMVALEYYGKGLVPPGSPVAVAPFATVGTHEYDTLSFAVDFNLTNTTTLVLQYSIVNAKATGTPNPMSPLPPPPNRKLDYDRVTVGWRVTF